MNSITVALAAFLAIIALMYVVPYTILSEPRGLSLYAYWTLMAALAVALAWVTVGGRGWRRG